MSGRWFRFYDAALDDPKVQRLPPKLFKAWVNLLCLASRNDGAIPPTETVAFSLRVSVVEATNIFADLVAAGLVDIPAGDDMETAATPHNWNARQYKSDVSNERVKRHRQRHSNGARNVTVTPSDTETETEQSSVPSGTGAGAPEVDSKKLAFDAGVAILTKHGLKEPNARSLIGKWRKDNGDEAVLAAIGSCQRSNVSEPVSWITATFKAERAEDKYAKRDREIAEAIERSKH